MNPTLNEAVAASDTAWSWLLLGEWLIAFGILAVAGGVLWAVIQNHRLLRAESTPNLIFDNLVFARHDGQKNAYTLSSQAVNLGRFPVYLRALTYGTDTMHSRAGEALHVLIPPGESRDFEHVFDHLTVVEGGTLGFEFQYGATGTRVHKLEFPLSLTRQNDVVVKAQHSGERASVAS